MHNYHYHHFLGVDTPFLLNIRLNKLGLFVVRQFSFVVDFLDFYWGNYHFPAFNIADSAITLGAILIILDMLLGGRRAHD